MAYHSGELTERVTFRREVRVPDGMGGSELDWSELGEVWALVRPMSGRERQAAHQIEASADYLIVIRSPFDVQEADIAEWQGRQLNIRFVKRRGTRSLFLEMEAEMGVAV